MLFVLSYTLSSVEKALTEKFFLSVGHIIGLPYRLLILFLLLEVLSLRTENKGIWLRDNSV